VETRKALMSPEIRNMVYGRPDVSGLLNAQAAPDDRLWADDPAPPWECL
jgi:hypothetical protein